MDKTDNISGKMSSECIPFLPVELITNILSRLDVKSAMRCRLVCKGWRDLTSARDFIDLHFRRRNNSILVETWCSYRLHLVAVENWWQRAGNGSITHTIPCFSMQNPNSSDVLFSHAGLIAFPDIYGGSEAKFVIMNPTRPSNESVRISLPNELRKSKILGVYFNHLEKEYCSLWKILEASNGLYGVLRLSSDPYLKMIDYPFSSRVEKDLANPIFTNNANPLFIKNCLYWMLKSEHELKYSGRNDIMEFDVLSEEFKVIICPVPFNTECMHYHTHLLDIDGCLSFLLLFPSKITIWRLEDRAEQLWKTTEYNLEIDVCRVSLEEVRGIVVMGENLGFVTEGKLFACDLVEGSVKNGIKRKWRGPVFVLPHQMSLASLKDCKSTISIDKSGKVKGVRIARVVISNTGCGVGCTAILLQCLLIIVYSINSHLYELVDGPCYC